MYGSISKALMGAGIALVGNSVATNAMTRIMPELTPSFIKRVGWALVAIVGAIGGIYGTSVVVDSYKEIKENIQ